MGAPGSVTGPNLETILEIKAFLIYSPSPPSPPQNSSFLKVERIWQPFLLTDRDQIRAYIVASGSPALEGCPNRVQNFTVVGSLKRISSPLNMTHLVPV